MPLYDLPDEIVRTLRTFTRDNQGPFLLSEIPLLQEALRHPAPARDRAKLQRIAALPPSMYASDWARRRVRAILEDES